jgi:CDGSH-type Zn-finger protein
MDVKITAETNGPLVVTGPIELYKNDGTRLEVKGNTVLLCRCGHSNRKPFCDSTHKKIEFKAD